MVDLVDNSDKKPRRRAVADGGTALRTSKPVTKTSKWEQQWRNKLLDHFLQETMGLDLGEEESPLFLHAGVEARRGRGWWPLLSTVCTGEEGDDGTGSVHL